MTVAINPQLEKVILAAVDGVKRLVLAPDADLGYIHRQDVPIFKTNEHGWPSVARANLSSLSRQGPMNWNTLFSVNERSGSAPFGMSDVPELQEAANFVLEDPDLRLKISVLGGQTGDSDRARSMTKFDVVNAVTTIAQRSENTGESTQAVYLQYERALLSPTLVADILIPITLVTFDLDEPILLSEDVWIERLDEQTHRARAVGTLENINPYLVAAATHAVVLGGRPLDNSRGPLVRQLQLSTEVPFSKDIDQVFQALEVATNRRLGYVQVALRPRDWGYDWLGSLPPIENTIASARLPVELLKRGWNATPLKVASEQLTNAPTIYQNLQATDAKGKLAARRLLQSAIRTNADDTLLDACIGIEALLGEQRDELTHRMGLRAAVALAGIMSAEAAYTLLKNVYNHRSKIVHGTEPKNTVIKFEGGEWSPRSVAVWLLRALLRSHLTSTPRWTAQSLDQSLYAAIDKQHVAAQ